MSIRLHLFSRQGWYRGVAALSGASKRAHQAHERSHDVVRHTQNITLLQNGCMAFSAGLNKVVIPHIRALKHKTHLSMKSMQFASPSLKALLSAFSTCTVGDPKLN